MTISEVRKLISESENREIFSTEKIIFKLPKTGIDRIFAGISSFYEYLIDQEVGYDSMDERVPKEFKESQAFFSMAKKQLIDFLKAYNNIRPNEFQAIWNQRVMSPINNYRNSLIFETNAPNTKFLIDIFRNRGGNYNGARDYLTNSILSNELQKRDYINGVILAYEYFQKGETEIKKRRDIEKSSLSRFRNHIDDYISQADKDFIEYSAGLKEKTDKTIEEIGVYKSAKSEEYEKWFSNTSTDFSSFDEMSKKKILGLEELYREKLKLEAPAQYWNLRAIKLRKEGYLWLAGLIVSLLGGVGIFIYALQLISDGSLTEIFDDTATAIKWSVIFITLVSFLAFLIKTLSKMTFSTFHLVRDAEEREQLTFVFLAMQKEKAIDPTERHLIMQSLFSRADTGLLKDDGSPTMPGNIFDKVIAGNR